MRYVLQESPPREYSDTQYNNNLILSEWAVTAMMLLDLHIYTLQYTEQCTVYTVQYQTIHTVHMYVYDRSTWCSSSFSSYHPCAVHLFLHIILVQNSQCGKELNKFCPPNNSNDLCLLFCKNPSSTRPSLSDWSESIKVIFTPSNVIPCFLKKLAYYMFSGTYIIFIKDKRPTFVKHTLTCKVSRLQNESFNCQV